MKLFSFLIDSSFEGIRIDKFIAEQHDELTRSYIQKLIKDGHVFVNNHTVKSSYSLKDGDNVSLEVPDNIEPNIKPEKIDLDIIYEDHDLIIINKPKNMVVHPAPGHYSGTLVNAIMYYCKEELSGINGVLRPGIVHRIDKDTSGSIIVCKNDFTHNSIAEQLKDHSIKRIYHAIVHGQLDNDGTVNAPIGRDSKDRLKMAISPNGKYAVTHYHVIKKFNNYTYISCQLETGRTHQIRVHMSSIGHPIVGDDVYGKNHLTKFKCNGQTLHAKTIGFIHPRTGKYLEFDTELPLYFNNLLRIMNGEKKI